MANSFDRQKRHRKPDTTNENQIDEDHANSLSTFKITPKMFIDMCPALLVQLDQRACSDHVLRRAVPKTVGFGMGEFILHVLKN